MSPSLLSCAVASSLYTSPTLRLSVAALLSVITGLIVSAISVTITVLVTVTAWLPAASETL